MQIYPKQAQHSFFKKRARNLLALLNLKVFTLIATDQILILLAHNSKFLSPTRQNHIILRIFLHIIFSILRNLKC